MTRKLLQIVAFSLLLLSYALAASAQSCQAAVVKRHNATTLYSKRDLAGAITELRYAIQLCPSEPFYHFMLGNALYRAGELKGSAAEYEEFLVSRPSHLEGHMSLGFTLFELGEKNRAVEEWTAAVREDPRSPFAHSALAVGLYSTGDPDNAVIQCEVAAALDPRYRNADELAIDIRWKPAVRLILSDVIRLSDSRKEN